MDIFCRQLLKTLHILKVLVYSIPILQVCLFKFFSKRSDRQSKNIWLYRPEFLTIFPGLIIWSVTQMLFLFPSKGLDDFRERINSRSSARTTGDLLNVDSKLKGVHYFGRFGTGHVDFKNIIGSNIEHLVLVPYGHMESIDNPALTFKGRGRRTSIDRDSMFAVLAQKALDEGLQVIIKPQIWLRANREKWITDIDFKDKAELAQWTSDYTDFIIHYARLSERVGASHFCIGTELTEMTRNHPEYWRSLISQVRKIYSGKIFYAGNWYKEYEQITFWKDLDLIGVQAYFPICKKDHPTLEELVAGWQGYKKQLKKLSQKLDKPILFSELGYRSSHNAASEPWVWVDDSSVSTMRVSRETQAHCYEAFFQTFWHEPWFAGALIWQWQARFDNDPHSMNENLDFTPQHKPAQDIITRWFAR